MVRKIAGSLVALMTLVAAGAAQATPITFNFEADIVAVGGLLQPVGTTAGSGHTLSGQVTYEDTTPVIVGGGGTIGFYTGAVTNLILRVEPLGLIWTNSGPGNMTINNDRDLGGGNIADRFILQSVPIVGPTLGAAGVTMFPLSFTMNLVDLDETVFNSLSLPSMLDLSQFEGRVAQLLFEGIVPGITDPVQQVIDTRLTSLEVPEPGTLMLMLVGLLGLAIVGRRRQNAVSPAGLVLARQ